MAPLPVAAILCTISYITTFILLILAMFLLLDFALPRVSPALRFLVILTAVDLFFFGLSSSIFLSLAFFKPPGATVLVSFTEAMSRVAMPVAILNTMGFFAEIYSRCSTGRSLGHDLGERSATFP